MTKNTQIRELTTGELEMVSGGNAAIAAGILTALFLLGVDIGMGAFDGVKGHAAECGFGHLPC